MSKPLTGKKWFYAKGARAKSLGYTWFQLKAFVRIYNLPAWAQRAIVAGHLNQGQ